MKKFLTLFLVLVMGLALAACGDDKKDTDKADVTTGDTTEGTTDSTDAGEDAGDVEFSEDYYKEVYDALVAKGYEVKVLGKEDDPLLLDVTDNVQLEINQEDFLPLQILTIEPDSEHLGEAEKTGEYPLEYEGETGTVPVTVSGHHIFFLGEGHPDYAGVMEVVDSLK